MCLFVTFLKHILLLFVSRFLSIFYEFKRKKAPIHLSISALQKQKKIKKSSKNNYLAIIITSFLLKTIFSVFCFFTNLT
jgi:hypothetical protein